MNMHDADIWEGQKGAQARFAFRSSMASKLFRSKRIQTSTAGGCDFAADFATPAPHALYLWQAAIDPNTLTSVLVDRDISDSFAIAEHAGLATVFCSSDGRETLIISGTRVRLQFELVKGSFLDNRFTVAFVLPWNESLLRKINTLARLQKLSVQHRRAPKVDFAVERAILQLRAWDAHCAGLSAREIAEALFPQRFSKEDWRASGESLRSLVRRLIADAEQKINGGYRQLFRTP